MGSATIVDRQRPAIGRDRLDVEFPAGVDGHIRPSIGEDEPDRVFRRARLVWRRSSRTARTPSRLLRRSSRPLPAWSPMPSMNIPIRGEPVLSIGSSITVVVGRRRPSTTSGQPGRSASAVSPRVRDTRHIASRCFASRRACGAGCLGRRHRGGAITFWFPRSHGDRRAASGRNTGPEVDVSGHLPVDVHGLRRRQAHGVDYECEVTLACALSTCQVYGAWRLL